MVFGPSLQLDFEAINIQSLHIYYYRLVVESAQRRQADLRRVEKQIQKLEQEARQKLKQLSSQKFSFQPDAIPAAIQLSGQLKYHKLTN